MEKRSEPRFAVEQDVYVRVLDGARAGMAARIVNRSANGLALALGCPVAAGTAIEVNGADAVLLGEVVYCREEQNGWTAGIRVEHGIFGLAGLRETRPAVRSTDACGRRPDARSRV